MRKGKLLSTNIFSMIVVVHALLITMVWCSVVWRESYEDYTGQDLTTEDKQDLHQNVTIIFEH